MTVLALTQVLLVHSTEAITLSTRDAEIKKVGNKMPDKNGQGPPEGATGYKDGGGGGKGYHAKKGEKGSGSKTGGEKGEC